MAVTFIYGSIAGVWIVLMISAFIRPVTFKSIMVGITGVGYSLLFECVLGEQYGLYYYVRPEVSLFYIIITAVFLYPILEIIYTLFLPNKFRPALIYTFLWIILMLVFELISMYTKSVILTGWKVMPWSIITYIATFGWVNLLFRYIKRRGL